MKHDIVIIGGGPAGLAAAISARESGVEDVLDCGAGRRAGRHFEPVHPQRLWTAHL